MKLLSFLLGILLIVGTSCSQNQEVNAIFKDCTILADTKILSEAAKSNTCIYLEVYRYQSEIYTLCECCVCDKASMAINCEGEPLCDFSENCLVDFYREADYLFSVTSE